MNILLATHYLDAPRGTETWSYTLSMELARRGHRVTVAAFETGEIARLLMARGIAVIKAGGSLHTRFDRTVCNHNTILSWLATCRNRTGPILCFLHGVLPRLEQPIPGADGYVAISEEVAQHAARMGFRPAAIIPNFIDLERFRSRSTIGERVRTLLYLSNHDTLVPLLDHVCRRHGISLLTSRQLKTGMFIEEAIDRSDAVVTIGRGVYEAMAMSRAAFVGEGSRFIGRSIGDGFVTPSTLPESIRSNCNGKRFAIPLTPEFFDRQLERVYHRGLGMAGRHLARSWFDVRSGTDHLLSLFGTIKASATAKGHAGPLPVAPRRSPFLAAEPSRQQTVDTV
jgi:glycosyltransferase involved in cell wall biosynthesis